MSMKQSKFAQPSSYPDGLTKQAFKDETDIKKILHRAQKAGTLSHLAKYEAHYGDFADYDFMDQQIKLTQGREMFDELPSEVRTEFSNSPAAFFAYVNDPANAGRLRTLLPALAAPGRQNLDVSGRTPPERAALAREPQATENQATATPPADGSQNPAESP